MISNWLQNEALKMFPAYKQFSSGVSVFFIHIPKTAGTSIRQCLDLPRPKKSNGLFKKHYSHQEIQQLVDPTLWHNAFKFSFVRNPWDRLYSYYHYIKRKHFRDHPKLDRATPNGFPSFETWVEQEIVQKDISQFNFRPQYTWIYDEKGSLQVDFLGRFENLSKDFDRIKEIIGISADHQLEYVNSTERPKDYRLGYNKRTKEVVGTIYKKDIELFNYTY